VRWSARCAATEASGQRGNADNLTDALSMHIYQESERRLESREAFVAT
jgi:hypothetical protein